MDYAAQNEPDIENCLSDCGYMLTTISPDYEFKTVTPQMVYVFELLLKLCGAELDPLWYEVLKEQFKLDL